MARRFAAAGYALALASRNPDRLGALVAEIEVAGGTAKAYGADATKEEDVVGLFDAAERDLGPAAIAETYYQTHAQHPSAWSTSVELRPWAEGF